jgi:hypothetical protein
MSWLRWAIRGARSSALMPGVLPGGGDGVLPDFDPFSDMARLASGSTVKAIVDGGAFIGSIACRLADAFPEATVYAFDPQLESFRQLEEFQPAASRDERACCRATDQDCFSR